MRPGDVILRFKEYSYKGMRGSPDLWPDRAPGHAQVYLGNGKIAQASAHYKTHPQDDVSIKSYTGGGNLFCRPASA